MPQGPLSYHINIRSVRRFASCLFPHLVASLPLVSYSMSSPKKSSSTSSSSVKAELTSKMAERAFASDEKVKGDESFLKVEPLQLLCAQCGEKESNDLPLLVSSRCKNTT